MKKAESFQKSVLILIFALSLAGFIYHVLHLAGLLSHAVPAEGISIVILLFVGSLAGYLAFDRETIFDGIKTLVDGAAGQTVQSLRKDLLEDIKPLMLNGEKNILHTLASIEELITASGVNVRRFDDVLDVYEYAHKRMETAKSVDDLTWGHRIDLKTPAIKKAHEQYIRDIILLGSKENCLYREVMTFNDLSRVERAEKMLGQRLDAYRLRYYNCLPDETPPLIKFVLIDSDEVLFVRPQHIPSERVVYLSVKHPDIVQLFQYFYDAIWDSATVLKDDDKVYADKLKTIREQLERT